MWVMLKKQNSKKEIMSYYKTIYQHYTMSFNHFPKASNLLISAGFTNDS